MDLAEQLRAIMGSGRVLARPFDRIAYASDASFYRAIPQVVVQPETVGEICALFSLSHARRVPLTYRAAGTSLSGQAITTGILVDLSKHWGRVQVEGQGARVRAQPGVVGSFANAMLAPFSRRIGPDPASIDACMLGGILANNSSGMCCGVVENAYRTLASVTFALSNGLVIDSAAPSAALQLVEGAPTVAAGLLDLRQRILAAPALAERIRTKFRTKNTNGYALNALVDYTTPLDILSHLLIGSEGTLGFIAEAVLNTVPVDPCRYTGLLFFGDVAAAACAIGPFTASGARALEIMDRSALRSVEQLQGMPKDLSGLPETAAGLLVEYQSDSTARRGEHASAAHRECRKLDLLDAPRSPKIRTSSSSCGNCAKAYLRPSGHCGRPARPWSSKTSPFR